MSIEQAMYFALGFLVAGLLTLMFTPALWRRAMRLSMRRLQMLAPLSREEAIAERDLLRAEFALRERRTEQEMEAVRASKAQDLLEIGRHAARIASLDESLGKSEANGRELDHQLQEARKTASERAELLSAAQTALLEITQRAERGVAGLRAMRSKQEELGREKDEALARLAVQEGKIGELSKENEELRRELEKAQVDFAEVAAEAKRLGALDAEVARLTDEFGKVSMAKDFLEETLSEARARVKQEEERQVGEIAHLEKALRLARAEARGHAAKLETARADNSMLQGAIEALRADHARRKAGNGLNPKDVADLRKEISGLAAKIAGEAPHGETREETASAKRA